MSEVTTIQLTSKKLKFHKVISYFLITLGILMILMNSGDNHDKHGLLWGSIWALIGFAWLIVTRVRIWWNHK